MDSALTEPALICHCSEAGAIRGLAGVQGVESVRRPMRKCSRLIAVFGLEQFLASQIGTFQ